MQVLDIIWIVLLALETIVVVGKKIITFIREGRLKDLTNCIKTAMQEAENKFKSGQGLDKMTYVLSKVRKECDNLGINYVKIESAVKELVNKIVEDYNVIEKRDK